MADALMDASMAKKRSTARTEPKRSGTMIRVNEDFAEAFRKACALEGFSSAEFADVHFLPVVRRLYRDLLAKESKQLGQDG